MPCFRCGARQTDPIRGASPWKRGVRSGAQVLVCPECQGVHDWTAELDACGRCGSTMLVRALGETQCRSCGAAGDEAAGRRRDGDAAVRAADPVATTASLAADVAAALDRMFRGAAVQDRIDHPACNPGPSG
jgi:hypothetical protein